MAPLEAVSRRYCDLYVRSAKQNIGFAAMKFSDALLCRDCCKQQFNLSKVYNRIGNPSIVTTCDRG